MANSDWIPRAFHVFGSNCEFIENSIKAEVSKAGILAIYRREIAQNMNLFHSSPMLRPREGEPDDDKVLESGAGVEDGY